MLLRLQTHWTHPTKEASRRPKKLTMSHNQRETGR